MRQWWLWEVGLPRVGDGVRVRWCLQRRRWQWWVVAAEGGEG